MAYEKPQIESITQVEGLMKRDSGGGGYNF